MHDIKSFFWDEPYLYRSWADGIIHRIVPEVEMLTVLEACHSSPLVGIALLFGLHTKFCSVDTICQPFIKTIMILPSLVSVARERVKFQRGSYGPNHGNKVI